MSLLPIDPAALKPLLDSAIAAISAYVTYKVGMRQAEAKGAPPEKSVAAQHGEAALAAVTATVAAAGSDDERADLANFERNPERYGPNLARVMYDLAERDPSFVQRLAALMTPGAALNIGQANAETVNGPNVGTNSGTLHYTYNASSLPADRGDT